VLQAETFFNSAGYIAGCRRQRTPGAYADRLSAGEKLAYGLVRKAEQGADIALSQSLRPEVLSRPPCLHCGFGTDPLSLLTGLAGLGYLVGQASVQDGYDLDPPYLVVADVKVQGQQVAYHVLGLIEAPDLGVSRVGRSSQVTSSAHQP
jgi:hypothetical protein